MIKKIALVLTFLCLCIAIPLAIMGYRRVEIGASGMALIKTTARELQNYKVEIPSIPQISYFNVSGVWYEVLNFLIRVVNGLTALINFLITIFNYIIQLIEFLVLIVKNLITFKDSLAYSVSSISSLSV